MRVLAIEASTSRSSVAIVDGEQVLASASLGIPRRHGEFLAPALRFCLDHAGLELDRIGGVAVGTGPGLYTGLRVGIATAQTLAAARELPTVGVSGLDVLAFRARHTRRLLCAAIDARRGEIFWALYRPSPGGVQLVGEVRLTSAEALAIELEGLGEPCLVVGDASLSYREPLARVADVAAPSWPDAADLAELAHPRFVREETVRPDQLRPLYLRHPDAAIGWQARGRLRGGEAPG
ncbi:tRNA (adenosine(37)-N6)-threonylcarbamoyltransferase complex dimerization subunit type 1 TsaB [Nitriliruptor alkaliphilus]|uniref:tRNA (adenosine(37)-N6)-threonylcarbamoyltransferase complex dimerization subunit type 1 TsaB n=1 Tax=Nitriliruptor alkaliphilus TaxID=427918 RepID=UPI000696893D|nr:tRNA (adenosine(37)-N6)-threonylcarbamoyltransferase complex dimerization subunit type 1 TsaB [Nitriliruptor alkaliphilus]